MKIFTIVKVSQSVELLGGNSATLWGWTIAVNGHIARESDGQLTFFTTSRKDAVRQLNRLKKLSKQC